MENLGPCNSFNNDPGSGCCLLESRRLLEYIPSERFLFDTAIYPNYIYTLIALYPKHI